MKISNRQRARWVGVLIIVAYSMLIYSISNDKILGFITDVISGLAVLSIPVLLYPFFAVAEHKILNYVYLASRWIEGLLMILGGVLVLIPDLEIYRNSMYQDIHIYFFISGALFFYILLYRTQLVPKYISIWGFVAAVILFQVTLLKMLGFNAPILDVFLLPMILNELYLAVWLMIKGFSTD